MSQQIPDGAFKQAVRRHGVASVKMTLGVYAVWLAILFVPWVAIFEGKAELPLGLKAIASLTSGDGLHVGWLILAGVHALLSVATLYYLWRSIVTIVAPHQSSVVGALKEWGDPAAQIASFEAEAKSPLFAHDKPIVIATRSWLMVSNGAEVLLAPKSEIVWVYGAEDDTGQIIEAVGNQAGAVGARQQAISKMLPDMNLVVWLKDRPESLTISVNSGINPILKHFVQDAPHVVVGYSEFLEEIWKADRDEFLRRGRALGGVDAPAASGAAQGDDVFAAFGASLPNVGTARPGDRTD